MASGSGREGERPHQWQACHGVVGEVAAQHLHNGIVGAGGGWGACCGVGGLTAGRRWQGGMTEAAGVPLQCLGCCGVVEV